MTSSAIRNKVLLASQGITALVAGSVNLLAFWLIPGHWQAYLWVGAVFLIVVLLPLVSWLLPESPRWLETHGRHAEAERVVAEFEERCRRASGRPLPEPDQGMHPVVVAEKGAWQEIFRNPQYRGRTIVALICWLLESARTRTDSMTTPDASAGPMVRIRFPPASSQLRTQSRFKRPREQS
jgi:putative MFS transporter